MQVVNGPEVLSKFVGETEKNVRDLFADAEKDQKAQGELSLNLPFCNPWGFLMVRQFCSLEDVY